MRVLRSPQRRVKRFVFGAPLALVALSGQALAAPVLTSVSVAATSPGSICQGSPASYIVTVTRTGNGNLDVYLSAQGLPAGATATFTPSMITFVGSSIMSASAQLVISAPNSIAPGPNQFLVIGDDGQSFNTKTNVVALDVTMCHPGAALMANGGICIALEGTAGAPCSVQATTNLLAPVVWTTLCSTNVGTNSLLVYADMDAPKYPCRFYRLSMP